MFLEYFNRETLDLMLRAHELKWMIAEHPEKEREIRTELDALNVAIGTMKKEKQ